MFFSNGKNIQNAEMNEGAKKSWSEPKPGSAQQNGKRDETRFRQGCQDDPNKSEHEQTFLV